MSQHSDNSGSTPSPVPEPGRDHAPASNPPAFKAPSARAKPPQPRKPWLWNVVLLDDQEHTDVYVVKMVQELFAMDAERADLVAQHVDAHGRAIVATLHKELAELKCEQILGYGRDPHVASCKGSMNAVIEPAVDEHGTPPGDTF